MATWKLTFLKRVHPIRSEAAVAPRASQPTALPRFISALRSKVVIKGRSCCKVVWLEWRYGRWLSCESRSTFAVVVDFWRASKQ